MWQYQKTDELYHHGVLGMKWGVRRYQNKDGSLTSAGKKRYISDDAKKANNIKRKKLNEMSNDELKTLNYRQQLERTYKMNNKTNIAIGIAAVSGTLSIIKNIANWEDTFGKLERLSKRGKKVVGKFTKK